MKRSMISLLVLLLSMSIVIAGECDDGRDNDGDNAIDSDDLGCLYTKGNNESIGDERNPIATNLQGIYSFSSQIMFVDVMKRARPWTTSNDRWRGDGTDVWDTKLRDEIPSDINGYPLIVPYNKTGPVNIRVNATYNITRLTTPQIFKTPMLDSFNGQYPGGIYTVLYDGQGILDFRRSVTIINQTQGRILLNVTSTNSGIELRILRTNLSDHIRNIRVIMPGFENNYSQQIFYPSFLNRLKGFSAIRYMQTMRTNGDGPTKGNWSLRKTPSSYTQSGDEGISPEYIIAISNRIGTNPWITLHHTVDDEFVREYAKLMKRDLDPSLNVYVEYSNELWNSAPAYSQTPWNWIQACNNSITFVPHTSGTDWGILGCNDGISGYRRQSWRSAQIFKIFKEEFGNESDRVKTVLASQSSNPWTGEQLLKAFNDSAINPHNIKLDALAIAPYFGNPVSYDIVTNNEIDTINVTEIVNRAAALLINNTQLKVRANKVTADKYGVDLIAYEGGQHLVYQSSDTLTQKYIEANRNPKMKDAYDQMLEYWYGEGGGLFTTYSYVYEPNKFGSWGILEYQNQLTSEAPKFEAHLQAMKEFGSNLVSVPYTPTPQPTPSPTPQPSPNQTDPTPPPQSKTGGSSGGGSSSTAKLTNPTTPLTNTLTKKEAFFLRGKRYKFETQNRFIKRIDIEMKKDSDEGSIQLSEKVRPSLEISRGRTLQAFDITPTLGLSNPESIDSGEIIFHVPESWINENNIDEVDGVKLARLSESWTYYDSEFQGQNGEELIYITEIPGFSEFVIIGLTKRELLMQEKNQKIISLAGLSIALIIVGSGIAIIIIFLQIDAVRRRKKKALEQVRKSQELVRSYVGKIGE